MTTTRTHYGVCLAGCSGREVVWCDTRSTADRVRRVYRAWCAAGLWSGARTLYDLAVYAAAHRGERTQGIIAGFRARHNEETE